jgi:excisionase family DNA binding protein
MEPLLLKAGDVGKLLGLGRSKVFAMVAAGELPVIRIGRSVRVPRAALERWVAAHTQNASSGTLFTGSEDRDASSGPGCALRTEDVR